MVSEVVLVDSPLGIHLRPAVAMCDTAVNYKSSVYFKYDKEKTANAKSVISIIASGVKCGGYIEIFAEGEDEEKALKAVTEAFVQSLKND